MRRVVFVGDQPSSLNKDPKVAFLGARCYPRLLKWIKYLEVTDYELINSHKSYLLDAIKHLHNNGYRVIALGNEAHKRLKRAKIPHGAIGHPSGLNRALNDKSFEINMLDRCKDWIYAI